MVDIYIGFAVLGVLILFSLYKINALGGQNQSAEELSGLRRELSGLEGSMGARLDASNAQMTDVRNAVIAFQVKVNELLDQKLTQMLSESRLDREATSAAQLNSLGDLRADLNNRLTSLTTSITEQLSATGNEVRNTLNERLAAIQVDNANKLEEMRKTVDEKLHATLEQRLGESFKQVSTQLEQVHRGLGEMQVLATGVGDLKRVLTNVKTRGTWGEVQLGALLEQVLTNDQYAKNVVTKPNTRDLVEFAIKLPGKDADTPVWLPVDAKFPMEDYQRLIDAQERADLDQVESAGKALENRIKQEAKTIRDKYIEPPYTTDFGILFLPTEGLYAEVLRRPGLVDTIQHDYRVSIAGPTTFSAILNSLQMGFKTLAIEQRSSEIWGTLGQIKTEFSKFGDVIEATKKKLEQATKQFDSVDIRTRAINKKLKGVDALPVTDMSLISVDDDGDSEEE